MSLAVYIGEKLLYDARLGNDCGGYIVVVLGPANERRALSTIHEDTCLIVVQNLTGELRNYVRGRRGRIGL